MEWFLAVRSFDLQIAAVWLWVENLGRSFGSNPLAKLRRRGFDPNCRAGQSESRMCV